jgi:hypothetical protein
MTEPRKESLHKQISRLERADQTIASATALP